MAFSAAMQIDPKDAPSELPNWPETVMGGKYVRLLEKQLGQLRGTDAHGNRKLHLDNVFIAHLLAFFNPTVRSLRTIEDFSQTRQVQKHLSIRKLCKSTLSDFHRIADPQRLEPIIKALRSQLDRKGINQRSSDASDLSDLLRRTIAVDGTFLPAVANVAWAIRNANNHGAQRYRARVDVHINVETWLPEVIVIPEPGQSEADSAKAHVQDGALNIYDRGFVSYALINAHYKQVENEPVARADFVIRYRKAGGNSPQLKECVDNELTDEDLAAGVSSDRVGYFISSNDSRHPLARVKLREVIVPYEENGKVKELRLITNLLHVPAAVIAQLYRYRWQIELFFRWLKSFGNFTHLISHSSQGVLTQFYVAIIAALLMYLHTGFRPSKYLFVLLSQVAVGAATLDEIMPILRERERQCELARQSAAKRRANKSS